VDALLGDAWNVVVVDDLSTGSAARVAPEATLEVVDITDGARLNAVGDAARPDAVFHLAAQSSVTRSVTDPQRDCEVNVVGTLNVLESAKRHNAPIVLASTGGALYGDADVLPTPETYPAWPVSPYGVSKLAFEHYLHCYGVQHDLGYVALRYANVYGPRQNPHGEAGVVAIFAGKMLSGEIPTIFGDGNQTRDYVFVDDVVHAFALAGDRGSGRLINIGTGLETSVNGLFRMLSDVTGFHGQPLYGPQPPGELRRISLDIALAQELLDWHPWTHLEDGLKETVAYMKGG
jgi:UDP-glucose 4-epimerase